VFNTVGLSLFKPPDDRQCIPAAQLFSVSRSHCLRLNAFEPGGGAPDIASVAPLVARGILGNPILGYWQRSFMPPIEHSALPTSLLDRFRGADAQSQLVMCLRFLARLSRPDAITFGNGALSTRRECRTPENGHRKRCCRHRNGALERMHL
jgi:hypothetical protein